MASPFTTPIKAITAETIRKQQLIFQAVLEQTGVEAEQAKRLARCAFGIYEGRLLLYRINQEEVELKELAEDLKGLVNSRF